MRARDFYEVLGVGRTAGPLEIRAAYRRLVRQLHPDSGQSGSERDRERLGEVMEAYAILGREDRRAAYDSALERAESALLARPFPRRNVWLEPRMPIGEPAGDAADLLRLLSRWLR